MRGCVRASLTAVNPFQVQLVFPRLRRRTSIADFNSRLFKHSSAWGQKICGKSIYILLVAAEQSRFSRARGTAKLLFTRGTLLLVGTFTRDCAQLEKPILGFRNKNIVIVDWPAQYFNTSATPTRRNVDRRFSRSSPSIPGGLECKVYVSNTAATFKLTDKEISSAPLIRTGMRFLRRTLQQHLTTAAATPHVRFTALLQVQQ